MGGFRKKLEIQKDKVEGAVKEQAGKATGNKKMELKGKAQKLTASVKAKIPTIKK
ncbi:MAG: CsbD family protein [Bacillota bacterium]|nr:CsbD family protein [Bacillota bacterium]MDW7678762.1 CsbD family protein [Bacillota bacterium]